MDSNEYHRLKLLEQRMDMQAREINELLGQIVPTIHNIVQTHRLFTVFVTTQLDELREKLGLPTIESTLPDAPAKEESRGSSIITAETPTSSEERDPDRPGREL